MKNLKCFFTFLLFCLLFVICYCNSDNNLNEKYLSETKSLYNSTLIRYKRFLDPFTASLINLIGFSLSIYGFGNDLAKDDFGKKDLNELKTLILTNRAEFKCAFLENEIDLNWRKIEDLYDNILSYVKSTDKSLSQKKLKEICHDKSEGLSKIYSNIKHFLSHKNIFKYISECGLFQSKAASFWAKETRKLLQYFSIILLSCERIYEYKTEFKMNNFFYEAERIIEYYQEKGFYEAFANDKKEFGLEKKWSENYFKISEKFITNYTFPLSIQGNITHLILILISK